MRPINININKVGNLKIEKIIENKNMGRKNNNSDLFLLNKYKEIINNPKIKLVIKYKSVCWTNICEIFLKLTIALVTIFAGE